MTPEPSTGYALVHRVNGHGRPYAELWASRPGGWVCLSHPDSTPGLLDRGGVIDRDRDREPTLLAIVGPACTEPGQP